MIIYIIGYVLLSYKNRLLYFCLYIFTAPCQSDSECALTEACIRGQCASFCDYELACGVNAECKMVNHNKQCFCGPQFTGNPDKECFRIPSPCRKNSDCPSDFSCEAGVCFSGCREDSNCAENEKCVDKKCMCKFEYFLFRMIFII